MLLLFLLFSIIFSPIHPQTTETTVLCDSNCAKCTQSPPYLCLSCFSNYNKQHNRCYKVSTDCESPCLQCAGDADAMRCIECPSGYWINGDWKCEKCFEGCETCQESGVSDCSVCTSVNETVIVDDEQRCCPLKYYMDYNYECQPCGQHCLNCFHQIRGCIVCEDGYYLETNNECKKSESDKDWTTIMWIGIGVGVAIFIVTLIGVLLIMRKPGTEFAKVGKTTYEVMLQKSLNKTTNKNIVHVCEKCSGMCVRCNKTAGASLASVCQKCKIIGKCAICKQAEEGLGPESNTPDVEAAIEHENEKLEFELGRLCEECAEIGEECYNCGSRIQ